MQRTQRTLSRRGFLRTAGGALAAVTIASPDILGRPRTAPADKLNVAFVGVGGRGGANLDGLSRGNNVIALCDVDWRQTGGAFQRFPDAKRYKDFRKMLDEVETSADIVSVSTPDHTHAVAALAAIRRGKHVYCEKPLAHSVREVRELTRAAKEKGVVTQLGNQGHSFEDIRRVVEWVRGGLIGKVHTVHAACNARNTVIGRGAPRPEAPTAEVPTAEVPTELDWDLWLGPAAVRAYSPRYLPGRWRSWRPFGNGTIGDWMCHVVDPSFWALDLGAPASVEAVKLSGFDPKEHADTFPVGDVTRFEFPAKGDRGPVTLFWYGGEERIPRPEEMKGGGDVPGTGAVIIGDKGVITHGSHGGGGARLLPEEAMRDVKRPEPSVPRVERNDHHRDFLRAVREGGKAGSDFAEYGGPLTELAMLGIVALSFPGRKLSWDASAMRFTDCDEANALLAPPYREGWTL